MTRPVILAIERDHQQASHLTAMARRLRVELLLVESVDRGLAVLNERLPDLILTPALLSFTDDAALTGRLRDLGDRAAHIQTLTTPIFANATPPPAGGSIFTRRRLGGTQTRRAVECSAETFGEQVATYLERAVHARPGRADVGTTIAAPESGTAPVLERGSLPPPAERLLPPVEPFSVADDGAVHVLMAETLVAKTLESDLRPPMEPSRDADNDAIHLVMDEAPIAQIPEAATAAEQDLLPLVEPLAVADDGGVYVPTAGTLVVEALELDLPPMEPPLVAEPLPTAAASSDLPECLFSVTVETIEEPADPSATLPTGAGNILVPASTAEITDLFTEAESDVDPAHPSDDWRYFDPDECRFAALIAKLDEITAGADDA